MVAGNQAFQKRANVALVLRTIQREGSISRVAIAEKLGLKKSSVTNIVSDLLERGLVTTVSEGDSSPLGGRKPVLLGLRGGFGCVAGIDMSPGVYRLTIVDLRGDVLSQRTGSIDGKGTDFIASFEMVMSEVESLAATLGVPLVGVGLGIPGSVNVENGRIIESWSFGLEDFDFVAQFDRRYAVPILLDNDSNCCAWGELWFDREPNDFLYVLDRLSNRDEGHADHGIGLGVVIRGEVYYGSSYGAGEFRSVEWRAPEVAQLALGLERLSRAENDPAVKREYLVELLGNFSVLASVLNPKKIYLGGDLVHHSSLITSVLKEDLAASWIGLGRTGVSLEYSNFGEHEVSQGAAGMVMSRLFSIPQLGEHVGLHSVDWETVFAAREH
jgi:hypothetical protein